MRRRCGRGSRRGPSFGVGLRLSAADARGLAGRPESPGIPRLSRGPGALRRDHQRLSLRAVSRHAGQGQRLRSRLARSGAGRLHARSDPRSSARCCRPGSTAGSRPRRCPTSPGWPRPARERGRRSSAMWCRSPRRSSGPPGRPAPSFTSTSSPSPTAPSRTPTRPSSSSSGACCRSARRCSPAPSVRREDDARDALLEHIRVCFDCCHFAVEFERPAEALDRHPRRRHQASAAFSSARRSTSRCRRIPAPPRRSWPGCGPFADATYLHQVVERRPSELRHYLDLPDALDAPAALEPRTGGSTFTCRSSRPSTARWDRRSPTSPRCSDIRDRHQRHAPSRDRNLHLGRAAGRPQDGSPRVDRPRIRLGAATPAPRSPAPRTGLNAENRRPERCRADRRSDPPRRAAPGAVGAIGDAGVRSSPPSPPSPAPRSRTT